MTMVILRLPGRALGKRTQTFDDFRAMLSALHDIMPGPHLVDMAKAGEVKTMGGRVFATFETRED